MIKNFSIKSGRVKNDVETIWGDNGLTHSPLQPNFYDQIEPGIQALVRGLIQNNYMTVSSCEGHISDRDPPHIIIATPSMSQAEFLVEQLQSTMVTVTISDTFSKIPIADEATGVNDKYMRSYEKYYFVHIFICDLLYEYRIPFAEKIAEGAKLRLQDRINALPVSGW